MQAVCDAVRNGAPADIMCFDWKPPDPPSDSLRGLGLGAREQLA